MASILLKHALERTMEGQENIYMAQSGNNIAHWAQNRKMAGPTQRQTPQQTNNSSANRNKPTRAENRIGTCMGQKKTAQEQHYTGETKIRGTSHQEYAGGPIHLMGLQEQEHLITQLQNYQAVTAARRLPIRWRKEEPISTKCKTYGAQITKSFRYHRIQERGRNHRETDTHGGQTTFRHRRTNT